MKRAVLRIQRNCGSSILISTRPWVWGQNEPAKLKRPLQSRSSSHRPTNPRRALNDGVEHRLHVRGRAADDAEHLGGRCLVLQSFAQLCVALPSSWNKRTFSMAMTAWSAKVFSRAMCFSEKGRTSCRLMLMTPTGVPSLSIGIVRKVARRYALERTYCRETRLLLPPPRDHANESVASRL